MPKNTSLSIRVDSDIKRESEQILEQLGLNITSTVNILLRQIIRERAVPLSLSLNTRSKLYDDLMFARNERENGYDGHTADEVALEMERVIAAVERGE